MVNHFLNFLIFTDINNGEEEQKYLIFKEKKIIEWHCLALDKNGFSDQCFLTIYLLKELSKKIWLL